MKQIKIYILISIMILSFIGCTKQPEKVEPTKYDVKQITLDKFKADVKIDENSKIIVSKVNIIKPIQVYGLYTNLMEIFSTTEKMALKKAFISALEKVNTPYFALVNPGFSNIEGFPINNFKDFTSYLKPDIKFMNGSRQILLNDDFVYKNDEVLLILLPIDKKMLEFVVWDTEKTKNELK